MAKNRASKGFLLEPAEKANISVGRREKWLKDAVDNFVTTTPANKKYYEVILNALWPSNHGIPGPILTEKEIRAEVDNYRKTIGKEPYKDVFRRLRELQGEEGFTCIIKEGTKYQIQSLELGSKREPRIKPDKKLWAEIKKRFDYKCAHCGSQEPNIKLSPDHKVPRSRSGGNETENWQPLCEQCNNLKSSACRGCNLNCYVCSWAFPETYKPIVISDENKELIKREAERKKIHQAELANEIIRNYFSKQK
ncbi:MAG: HNH endonuclease [Alphaproteobacteria bacterium]|jgi:5-methylcytosine-specific restriction endonuclease McrA|nr:HNH endonuclease [Alphaproteobacteria bacterium]QQS57514.1 MAG: HNH endonuclease [Alphaproteobacteria bacterium]